MIMQKEVATGIQDLFGSPDHISVNRALAEFRSRRPILITSGHENKLMVCFTKFDTTRDDDSRPRERDRRNYLLNSLDCALSEITGELGTSVARRLSRTIADRAYFLADLNRSELPEPWGTPKTGQ